jgi:hypothetical protein
MCSINHNKKAIFIHIPKNGGSYISEILNKYYGFKNYYLRRPDHKKFCLGIDKSVGNHENKIHGTLIYYKTSSYINKIMNMDKDKWESYFIFTFIRNPYDRIISGWNYVNKYNIPFNNYLNLNFKTNSFDYWHVFMTQTRHLIDLNGKTLQEKSVDKNNASLTVAGLPTGIYLLRIANETQLQVIRLVVE